jgi:hypothetical protein
MVRESKERRETTEREQVCVTRNTGQEQKKDDLVHQRLKRKDLGT